MNPRRLRRVVALAAAIVLGGATLAHASFSSGGTASQTISTLSVGAPTAFTGTPSGHNVSLGWTVGSGATATQLGALANGTSSTCPATGYTTLSASATPPYTDARFTPQGTYECYQAVSTHGAWSSSTNPAVAVQLGVVASSVAIKNGGVAGQINVGDSIQVTFNQPISTASGPVSTNTVCVTTTGTDTIVLGSTGAGTACSTAQHTLGVLTGLTISKKARWTATWTWSAGNTVLTVQLTALSAGATPTVTGTTVTFTPATTLLSATGGFAVCAVNTGGGNCLPVATGGF